MQLTSASILKVHFDSVVKSFSSVQKLYQLKIHAEDGNYSITHNLEGLSAE
jgi:hypothetical protein